MNNRKVNSVRFIHSVSIPKDNVQSLDVRHHPFEMHLTPPGVVVQGAGVHMLVPYANIAFMSLAPEEAEAKPSDEQAGSEPVAKAPRKRAPKSE